MKQYLSIGVGIALLATTLPATLAGPIYMEPALERNFYFYGFGGLNWLADIEGTDLATNTAGAWEFDDTGFTVGGGFGIRSDYLGGSRLEVDGAYRGNYDGVLVPAGGADIDVDQTSVHVNFLKEFNSQGYFVPYVGAGIGWTNIDAEIDPLAGAFAATTFLGEADVFSWSAIAGIEAALLSTLAVYTEYRYTTLSDFGFAFTPAGIGTTVSPDGADNHSLLFGIRVYF